MALIEVLTDGPDVRRTLAALGLPYAPVSFARPRELDQPSCPEPHPGASRGPPAADAPDGAARPFLDELGDPPWSDGCPPPPDDDTSQVPPDAAI